MAIGSAIFLVGFLIKLFHVHYNAVIMLLGLFLMLVGNIGLVVKKDSSFNGWLGLASAFWLMLLLFTIKFYPFSNIVLGIAITISIIGVIIGVRNKAWSEMAFLFSSFCFAINFYFIPSDTKYHLFNIRWNYEIATDFFSWDKYSWFLYQNGKYEEAFDASAKALEIANQQNASEWSSMIEEHQQKIQDRSWQSFR